MNQKGLVPVVIILILLVVLVGVVSGALYIKKVNNQTLTQASPVPSSIPESFQDWKVYTNTRNSFSIKHPNDFAILRGPGESALSDEHYQQVSTVGFISRYPKVIEVNITVDQLTSHLTAVQCVSNDECLEKLREESFIVNPTSTILRVVLGKPVKGLESKRQPYQEINSDRLSYEVTRGFLIPKNNRTYLITLFARAYSEEEYESNSFLLDQILATFYVIDQNKITYSSNWKTYENSTFKISYPPTWEMIPDEVGPTLYPPESDPELPSDNISFYLNDNPYEESAFDEQIIVAGVEGKVIDESEVPDPQPGFDNIDVYSPRMGGCPFLYTIYLPYKNKTLEISACTALKEPLAEMLKTFTLR